MIDIDQFLREAVFYPCSGLDGAPVQFLAKRFPRFFYADRDIDRATFETECMQPGFRGYRVRAIDGLKFQHVFQVFFGNDRRAYQEVASRFNFDWKDIFVASASFERLPDYPEGHGPPQFELMFARCEAITTFNSVFRRRGIAPKCLAYIRPGTGTGGNYPEFAQELERALRENPAGLPEFMLYDAMSRNSRHSSYLSLIDDYEPIERWNYRTEGYGWAKVTLARLRTLHGEQVETANGSRPFGSE